MASRYESRMSTSKNNKRKPKWLKRLVTAAVILVIIGGALYYFVPKLASDQISNYLDNEAEKNGGYDNIKNAANANPEVRQFLEEGAQADPDKLPFTTRDEATRVVLSKVGPGNLQKIQSMAKDGLDAGEQQEVLRLAEDHLSEDEILALKYVANKELNR